MPIYFSKVAPTCPLSQDSAIGPRTAHLFNRPIFNRPSIPPPRDFPSAINAANQLRNIIVSLTQAKTINNAISNVYNPNVTGGVGVVKDKFKRKSARWSEQKDKRVKRKYKYFGQTEDGKEDPLTWVIMERIERMVWYDRGWKSYLTWEYGDKGEGELVVSGTKTMREIQEGR
jgi:hypothetical protein